MFRWPQALMTASLLLLACCCGTRFEGGSGPGSAAEGILAAPGALPTAPHAASANSTIDGDEHDGCGGSVTDEPPAAVIDAAATPCSWARYVFGMPAGGELRFIGIEVEDVAGDYWVGLSDYGKTAGWEWHGPYTASSLLFPPGQPADYLSTTGNLYWVVLAAQGSSLRMVNSTVSFDWLEPEPVRRVPPPGQQLAAAGPAAFPSLVLMPEIEGVSEAGAPVIFYTGGEGMEANSYLAFYDGEEWAQRPLAPDQTLLRRARARWTTGGGVVAAYNASTSLGAIGIPEAVNVFRTEPGWRITAFDGATSATGYEAAQLALDSDAAGDKVVVAQSYRTDFDERGLFSVFNHQGRHSCWPQPWGDTVAAVTTALNPAGGPTLAMCSSGTADTAGTMLLDYRVAVHRFDDGWSFGTEWLDRGEPIGLDLCYDSAGDPQLLMVCGHDLALDNPPEIDTEATLRFDVSIGTWNGLYWGYQDLFTGTADVDYGDCEIDVAMAADAAWAGPEALSFSTAPGTVEYTTDEGFTITVGTLAVATHFYEDTGEGYAESTYFTGDPGLQFDWEEGAGGPCCAYIGADNVDIDVLLDVYAHQTGDLLYWSPGT